MTEAGVPQGGIISPLLSNLVLHELDKYIERIQKERNLEQGPVRHKCKQNPKYNKLSRHLAVLNGAKPDLTTIEGRQTSILNKIEKRRIIAARRRTASTLLDPRITYIKYVRYADDWVIGI